MALCGCHSISSFWSSKHKIWIVSSHQNVLEQTTEPLPPLGTLRLAPLCFDLYGEYICECLRGIFETFSYAVCIMITEFNQTTGLLSLPLLPPKPPPRSLCSNHSRLLSTWRVNNRRLFKAPPRHTLASWKVGPGTSDAAQPTFLALWSPVSCCFALQLHIRNDAFLQ